MRYLKRRRREYVSFTDDDPLSGAANLFDVAMIFAIGLLVVALTNFGISELLTQSDITIVKNPGQENMEIIVKHDEKIEKRVLTKELITTSGKKFGTIYEMENGGWVLVKDQP